MTSRAYLKLLAALTAAFACALPAAASASDSGGAAYQSTSSSSYKKATVKDGKAIAPSNAPQTVKDVIKAANRIVTKPYRYGGGHGKWEDSAYDCSGSVSYALHGGGLLDSPMPSSGFMHWAKGGTGKWITVYANSGHAFMVVAGLRFDTGYRDDWGREHGAKSGSGPRWGKPRPTSGFVARHPALPSGS
jgi:hypothetical protein